jgi:hypothetical protein
MPLQVPLVNFDQTNQALESLTQSVAQAPLLKMNALRLHEAQRELQEDAQLRDLVSQAPPEQRRDLAVNFLESKGRFKEAETLKAFDLAGFNSLVQSGDHQSAVELLNRHFAPILGHQIQYQPTKKDLMSTPRGIYDPNKNEMTYPFPEKPDTTGEGRTVVVGDRVMQYNPNSRRYDIDLGASPDSIKPNQPKQATNALELFVQDPEKAQAFMEMDARIRSRYRLDRNPSVAEFMTDLYKKDPDTFNGVFNRGSGEKAEDRMLRVLQLSKDPITGEIDQGTFEKITNLLKAGPLANDRMLQPSHGSVSPLSSSPGTQPGPTAINPRTKQRVRWNGAKWVPIQ